MSSCNADPFRHVDWRWTRAQSLVEQGCRIGHEGDPDLREAVHYLRALPAAESDSVRRRWPVLWEAHAMYQDRGVRQEEVAARLLCQPLEEVASMTGVPRPVLRMYCQFFFDVLDTPAAEEWLMDAAVGRANWRDRPPTPSEIWRYTALTAGPVILDLLIADDLGRPEPIYENRHELAQKARWRALEYAQWCWPASTTPQEMVEQACQFLRESRALRVDQALAEHLRFLRLAYGLGPLAWLDEIATDPAGQATKHHTGSVAGPAVVQSAAILDPEPAQAMPNYLEVVNVLRHV